MFKSKGHASEAEEAMMRRESGFIPILLGNLDLIQYLPLVSNVENTITSPSESIHSSMLGIEYESKVVSAFH